MHEWDGQTPLEETLEALDTLVKSGKVRYVGASNYAGWQLMKALGVSDRHGYQRFVTQQIYYSLEARDAEYEHVPLAVDQRVGILVWSRSRAACCRASSAAGRGPEGSRALSDWGEPPVRNPEQLSTRSRCSWRSARRTACPPPRSRSPGCSAGLASSP